MKIVINKCFGGYSLSRKAIARMAELNGKKAYFFTHSYSDSKVMYTPSPKSDSSPDLFFTAFDVPNPNEVFTSNKTENEMTAKERDAADALYTQHYLDSRPENRSDPVMIQVIEELGEEEASGGCAKLRIVNVPDGVEFEISEYDGLEHITETHRTWG